MYMGGLVEQEINLLISYRHELDCNAATLVTRDLGENREISVYRRYVYCLRRGLVSVTCNLKYFRQLTKAKYQK